MGQRIHFVTGKGGTGKSLMAAGLALREAHQGRRTLLIELGERSFFQGFFGLPAVGAEPSAVTEGLDIALWNGMTSLREYARYLIRVEALVRLFFENQVSRSLLEVAPALAELAILGKITSGPRHHGPAAPHDVLVVDAFSTGHFLSLWRAPRGIAGAIRMGPMGEQSRSIDETLRNPAVCQVHVVTLAEEMPVQETEELVAALRSEFHIEPSVILNRVVEVPSQAFDDPHPFARHLAGLAQRQSEMRERLRCLVPTWREVPQFFIDDSRALQAAVAEELT